MKPSHVIAGCTAGILGLTLSGGLSLTEHPVAGAVVLVASLLGLAWLRAHIFRDEK